jgi:hypothetical protein
VLNCPKSTVQSMVSTKITCRLHVYLLEVLMPAAANSCRTSHVGCTWLPGLHFRARPLNCTATEIILHVIWQNDDLNNPLKTPACINQKW